MTYDGRDLGHEIRLRHSSGQWIPTVVTAALLDTPGWGACALTLRSADTQPAVERSLRRRIVVEEAMNNMTASFINAVTPAEVSAQIDATLSRLALLTGAHTTSLWLEREEQSAMEQIGSWDRETPSPSHGLRELKSTDEQQLMVNAVLTGSWMVQDVADAPPEARELGRSLDAVALLSEPFTTGRRRGVILLARHTPGPDWSSEDALLARGFAKLIGRVLRASQSEALLTHMYRDGPLGVSIRNSAGMLVDCNDRYLEMQSLTRAEADVANVADLVHPDHRWSLMKLMERLHSGDIDRIVEEVKVLRNGGEPGWIRTNVVRLPAPGGSETYVLATNEDITDSYRQKEQLLHAATHDSLTGVANREAMLDQLKRLQDGTGPNPALIMIDLDDFKGVNDTMGHAGGDEVLRIAAKRITNEVRSADLVARLGGDEFAIVVAHSDLADLEGLAERLRKAIDNPFLIDQRPVPQSISIGVALAEHDLEPDDLLLRADRALYAAKAKGRNCHVVFDDSLLDEVLERLAIEGDLRRAIAGDELDVHFQPEVSLRQRKLVGAEALLRWHHPDRGLVTADQFIAVAESSGLIIELGRFALRTACQQFGELCERLENDRLTLRVNISAREFARTELPELVRDALNDSGIEAHRLCLEMTETTLMDSPEIAMETFGRLRELGVQFAIDDFGTGYSSLTYLKRFPVDALKIDRSFVQDITTDPESRAITESIIGLAAALDLQVVAEGIETQAQVELICQLGCDRAQGHLFAGALAMEDFIAMFTDSGPFAPARE